MYSEITGIVIMFGASLLLAVPLGKYMANVFAGNRTLLDRVMGPVERFFFQITGINTTQEMNWKQQMSAMLLINLI